MQNPEIVAGYQSSDPEIVAGYQSSAPIYIYPEMIGISILGSLKIRKILYGKWDIYPRKWDIYAEIIGISILRCFKIMIEIENIMGLLNIHFK